MLLLIFMDKNFLEFVMKKNCVIEIERNLELKMQSREKVISYMLNEKDTIICL